MDQDYRAWLWRNWGEISVTALKKHGFDAHFFPGVQEGRKYILEMISGYGSFGFGGSDTVRAMMLPQTLREMGKTVFDHWQGGLSKEEDLEIRLQQGRCDCFLCSANAVSLTGEIVNVDGVGNRTNSMTFGPKKVVIVAGANKLRPDITSALARVKETAAPMRAKSLNMATPCAETGICTDCNSPQRICRVTTILHRRPMLTDISVIIVGEELGF